MRILAIETSCDETAIAIVEFHDSRGSTRKKTKTRIYAEKTTRIEVLSSIVSSQVKLHAKYGGVVPNLAKREHQRNLVPILLAALKEAGLRNANFEIRISKLIQNSKFKIINSSLEREPELLKQFKNRVVPLAPPKIDAIAVTYGPGLAPALWVGVNFAKALAYLWKKPLIPVNHMAGHLYSALLQPAQRISNFEIRISKLIQNSKFKIQNLRFPALALLVSGGHTELVLLREHGKFKILGETLDDAAGEAFDKVARLLCLPYPGGPALAGEAEKKFQFPIFNFQTNSKSQISNFEQKIKLPRPMLNTKDHNFSFSGLKTAVLYLTRDLGIKKTRQLRSLIAKEFQNAVAEVLVKKTIRAAKEYKVKTVLLGGGVAANKELRKQLLEKLHKELPEVGCWMPETALAGDNALMIALASYFSGKKKAPARVGADANARLS